MKIHLRFDANSAVHSTASLFIDGENSGVLVASPAQMIWLCHILEHGAKDLSPPGRKTIEFISSGNPPEPPPWEIDKAVL